VPLARFNFSSAAWRRLAIRVSPHLRRSSSHCLCCSYFLSSSSICFASACSVCAFCISTWPRISSICWPTYTASYSWRLSWPSAQEWMAFFQESSPVLRRQISSLMRLACCVWAFSLSSASFRSSLIVVQISLSNICQSRTISLKRSSARADSNDRFWVISQNHSHSFLLEVS
jgi:hypothetical protein